MCSSDKTGGEASEAGKEHGRCAWGRHGGLHGRAVHEKVHGSTPRQRQGGSGDPAKRCSRGRPGDTSSWRWLRGAVWVCVCARDGGEGTRGEAGIEAREHLSPLRVAAVAGGPEGAMGEGESDAGEAEA